MILSEFSFNDPDSMCFFANGAQFVANIVRSTGCTFWGSNFLYDRSSVNMEFEYIFLETIRSDKCLLLENSSTGQGGVIRRYGSV